jgi:hypothetical protein
MLWVGTCITYDYEPKSRDFLESLGKLSDVRPFCVTVGFESRPSRVPFVEYSYLPWDQASDYPPDFVCLQHGDFLKALPDVKDEDTVILADSGDGRFQRDLTEGERAWLVSTGKYEFWMGPNAGPRDTLKDEFHRLDSRVSIHEFCRRTGLSTLDSPIFNGGFIVGKRSGWGLVRPKLHELWAHESCLVNNRKTQLFLNLAMRASGCWINTLDYSVHSHGHFSKCGPGITREHSMRGSVLHWRGYPVLYAHKVWG